MRKLWLDGIDRIRKGEEDEDVRLIDWRWLVPVRRRQRGEGDGPHPPASPASVQERAGLSGPAPALGWRKCATLTISL